LANNLQNSQIPPGGDGFEEWLDFASILSLNRSAALRCGSLENSRFAPHRSAALQSRFRVQGAKFRFGEFSADKN
jgi:hypothetical protein